MDLTPFLILPIVGGFAFSSTWTRRRYVAARESDHRLYYSAMLYALLLLLPIAVLAHVVLFDHLQIYKGVILPQLANLFGLNSSPIERWSDPSRASLLILSAAAGPILGHALNYHLLADVSWVPLTKRLRARFKSISISQLDRALKNNDLERLMMRSALNSIPILLSLDNGKIYVGFSIRLPNPEVERADVKILPLLSGYRDSSTHKIKFNTDYHSIYKLDEIGELSHLTMDDFEIVIPVARICSSHLFDLVAYDYLFRTDNDDEVKEEENADQ